jgi:protein-disulfide isomerase
MRSTANLLPLWGRGTRSPSPLGDENPEGVEGATLRKTRPVSPLPRLRRDFPQGGKRTAPLPAFGRTPPKGGRESSPWKWALFALLLTACDSHTSDEAFGKRVRAYLLSHPEVLQEVGQRLDAKLAVEQLSDQRRAEALLPSLRSAVERDPRDFVANPNGKITVTEFYDYRCPHCADAAPKVLSLIHDNPDVRFVFKEMPIFGPTSEHAARAALAVKKDGGDSLGLYQAFMSARPLQDDAIDPIARAKGARPVDLSPTASPAFNAQLTDTTGLFSRLALGGTPAFIVGDKIILGEDMEAVDAAVQKLRAKRA